MSAVGERALPSTTAPRPRLRVRAPPWRIWRSPPGQPRWARPALLLIAGLAGLTYAWGTGLTNVETYYGAAARSMSGSLHNFIFGAFDPAGTITVDKLPGALWLQALSLRLFGFHVWALLLPQVLEGALTVLVLYRAVRRLAGPQAAIAAAVVIASTPVTVALSRGNISDSLLILLTVLAADAASAAIASGRLRALLLAGVWIGLAFQAKMLQAWLVAPALGAAYLVAAPPPLPRRLRDVALAGTLTVVVSLSWMGAVSLVPASSRPYVDGTRNDSLFTQVFDYNGLARIGITSMRADTGPPAPFLTALSRHGDTLGGAVAKIPPSWHRLLGGLLGRDWGWLLPGALIAAVAALADRRRAGRRDPLRALVLLWGIWLLALAIPFSGGIYLNSYYTAALVPAVAALCGAGVTLFWRHRRRAAARRTLAVALLACAGYGTYLLHGGDAVPGWLAPVALGAGIVSAIGVLTLRPLRRDGGGAQALAVVALACALPLSAVTSLLAVTRNLGPFTAPYQHEPSWLLRPRPSAAQLMRSAQVFVSAIAAANHTPIPLGTDTSAYAAPLIFYTGREILPIGGYEGGLPVPTLSELRDDVQAGKVRLFILPTHPASRDPRVLWLQRRCVRTARPSGWYGNVKLAPYYCPAAGTAEHRVSVVDR